MANPVVELGMIKMAKSLKAFRSKSMKLRILILLCCMSFSIMASAQASGGQIHRTQKRNIPSKKILNRNATPATNKSSPRIIVINENDKTCELAYDKNHFKPCIDISTKGIYTIPEKIGKYTVIKIGDHAFSGCKYLTSVIFPNTIVTIGEEAFSNCTGLETIHLSGKLESIERYAFWGCENLSMFTIPNSVSHIGECALDFRVSFSGESTNWYDSYPDGLIYIGKIAYKWKGKMPMGTELIIKEGTKGIAGNAFKNCRGLCSIVLPNSLKTIGGYAFESTNLKAIRIPENVVLIEFRAFAVGSSLREVISDITNPFKLEGPFFGDYYNKATLHVPTGTKRQYINAGWDEFVSGIIEY